VLFDPLTPDDVRAIALQYLETVHQRLLGAGKALHVDEEALAALVSEGYSPAYGARFLKRVIDERVKVPITQRWHEGTDVHVRLHGDEIRIDTRPAALTAGNEARLSRVA
jgi:ATP-dependent Clp protease ATP-binding subunit ClpA